MYTEQELIQIARRDNNKKRNYLVINRFQGKHLPAHPGQALAMFEKLAETVAGEYEGERLLLVGFAETATAIGSALAVRLGTLYMQTTREQIEGVSYLFFSEAHSHATEQKLLKEDLEQVLGNIDRILFVEDELTTGNTIMDIIRLLRRTYGERVKFSAASLLNCMNQEDLKRYGEEGIRLHYLLKTDHGPYTEQSFLYKGDGRYYGPEFPGFDEESGISHDAAEPCVTLHGAVNARRLTDGGAYAAACMKLWEEIDSRFEWKQGERILVLGTEEFMYPALVTAGQIEKQGCEVIFHATTRSPILSSSEPEYPLQVRHQLISLYDPERTTFVYNLDAYDRVLIITDAGPGYGPGLKCLTAALRQAGNEKIDTFRWIR